MRAALFQRGRPTPCDKSRHDSHNEVQKREMEQIDTLKDIENQLPKIG